MSLLTVERDTLDAYLPGLDDTLAAIPLSALENPENGAIASFRDAGGPALLIPRDYGGHGATALEAVRIQRAIASRSPSLAVATTMHHFSVATLVEMCAASDGLEWMLLQAIAQQRLLVASGFAEGQTARGILAPTMQAQRADGGFVVAGRKKPCSLSRSMNLLTASVKVPGEAGAPDELAVVLIPAESEGIERRPFWTSPILAGAESDELILQDVAIPKELVFYAGNGGNLDPIQVSGFLWFELLISASYLGVASALVERSLSAQRGEVVDRAALGIEMEGAMAALEGVAGALMAGQRGQKELARALFVRYAVQRAIERATALAVELLGGMAFITSPDVSYLLAASRALAFHPPSRSSASASLVAYLAGEPLTIE